MISVLAFISCNIWNWVLQSDCNAIVLNCHFEFLLWIGLCLFSQWERKRRINEFSNDEFYWLNFTFQHCTTTKESILYLIICFYFNFFEAYSIVSATIPWISWHHWSASIQHFINKMAVDFFYC